ncbi:MAG: STAS domain-containing protein [SAR324 cluster bacterium]|nr:STAS domain-containing protein [SAR324 cluster bacterium]
MEISHKLDKGICFFYPKGSLELAQASEFGAYMKKVVDAQDDIKGIVFNFAKITSLDSVGIQFVVDTFKKMRKSGGKFFLTELSNDVMEIFEMTNLDRVLTILPSDEDARTALK